MKINVWFEWISEGSCLQLTTCKIVVNTIVLLYWLSRISADICCCCCLNHYLCNQFTYTGCPVLGQDVNISCNTFWCLFVWQNFKRYQEVGNALKNSHQNPSNTYTFFWRNIILFSMVSFWNLQIQTFHFCGLLYTSCFYDT